MEIKIYNYKNGEIAFFEKDEKHLISKEEVSLLLQQNQYDIMCGNRYFYTLLADYIESKICKNKYTDVGLLAILEYFRNNNFKVVKKEARKNKYSFDVTAIYENNILVYISVVRDNENFGCYCVNEHEFEEFKSTIIEQLDLQF